MRGKAVLKTGLWPPYRLEWNIRKLRGAAELASRIIRNTYRVLMTRGQKGCFVYSPDPETRAWFREQAGCRPFKTP